MELKFSSIYLQLHDADNLVKIQLFVVEVGVLQTQFFKPFVIELNWDIAHVTLPGVIGINQGSFVIHPLLSCN